MAHAPSIGRLARHLSDRFPYEVRQRGDHYLHRVTIVEGGDDAVRAWVRGSAPEPYGVSLQRDGDVVRVACGCPHFESSGPCKHVWATLRVAEERGYLGAVVRRAGEITVVDPDSSGYPEGDHEDGGRRGADHAVAGDELDEDALGADLDDGEPEPYGIPSARDRMQAYWAARTSGAQAPRTSSSPWRETLALVRNDALRKAPASRWAAPGVELLYVLDAEQTRLTGNITLAFAQRRRKPDGTCTRPRNEAVSASDLPFLATELDRRTVAMLGVDQDTAGYDVTRRDTILGRHLAHMILPELAASGRLFVRAPDEAGKKVIGEQPLAWDAGPPWRLCLSVRLDGKQYVVAGALTRDGERLPLADPLFLHTGGFVVTRTHVALLDCPAFRWVTALRARGELRVPRSGERELVRALYAAPVERELPDELRVEEVRERPAPTLRLWKAPPRHFFRVVPNGLHGELVFDYAGVQVASHGPDPDLLDTKNRRLVVRDDAAEAEAEAALREVGLEAMDSGEHRYFILRSARRIVEVVPALLAHGFRVEAEGKPCRRGTSVSLSVVTGIDWFDVRGAADFEGASVRLPELLAALRKGERMVRLDSGELGLLPEEWLARYAGLAALGTSDGDAVRFRSSQAALLDAMLAALPAVEVDAAFARARRELSRFEGITPRPAPRGFVGELRPYQALGVGWLGFLRDMGLGGCLADDMGLGKTVQVLAALLERRRARRDGARPSLVVVPRSLVFNWKAEAARFTPGLSVLDFTGSDRRREAGWLAEHDVVLTTYGTLRRDAAFLAEVEFDYVVLDEAQAIKNAGTDAAKAARLLRCRHRLAVTGTPVENHLGELWSLFEFLNPGMLGTTRFAEALDADARNPSAPMRAVLAQALRPFILRRRKEEVAPELPPKVEQTVQCELAPAQHKLYAELREHFRASVLGSVDAKGLGRAKLHVLEALLRLRQAACHPALIDPTREGEGSAKLDALMPMLDEVVEEGHKALVFSQFTSFLALVRRRLDERGVAYEYLDGRTRDRQERVARFQGEAGCKLFLVSLKAGGLGLNLTAADYVFLLDPWWNPAVEAQAVDRAHRIGQTRRVFTYRLVARDTIEEKVLALQEQKRGLVEDLIGGGDGFVRNLTRGDLEMLFK